MRKSSNICSYIAFSLRAAEFRCERCVPVRRGRHLSSHFNLGETKKKCFDLCGASSEYSRVLYEVRRPICGQNYPPSYNLLNISHLLYTIHRLETNN